jgi:FtsZ-interacting cell division protein ZipA
LWKARKEKGELFKEANVEEVKEQQNDEEQDEGWNTWQWGEIVKETKVNITNAYNLYQDWQQ